MSLNLSDESTDPSVCDTVGTKEVSYGYGDRKG